VSLFFPFSLGADLFGLAGPFFLFPFFSLPLEGEKGGHFVPPLSPSFFGGSSPPFFMELV